MMRSLLTAFRAWDRPSQIAFTAAVGLLLLAVGIASAGPDHLRQPATIGVMGLVFTLQGVFLWANRGMVTPLTRAQRLYRSGDLQAARAILEDLYTRHKAHVQAMTLLGNTYRQLGMIQESVRVLSEAVNNHPNHYFSRYGFGRTLLVAGRYADAAQHIEAALANGAPPVVGVDAGEAWYRLGNDQRAVACLQATPVDLRSEPHRALMKAYLLYRLDAGQRPEPDVIHAGLTYWQAQVALFGQTPYGASLEDDIRAMQSLIKEA